jgi:hypothetical protein
VALGLIFAVPWMPLRIVFALAALVSAAVAHLHTKEGSADKSKKHQVNVRSTAIVNAIKLALYAIAAIALLRVLAVAFLLRYLL